MRLRCVPKEHPNKPIAALAIKLLVYTHGVVTTAQARGKKSPGAGFAGHVCSVSGKTAPELDGPSWRMQDGDAHPAPSADGPKVCDGCRECALFFAAV